jgi:hypothetical protein
VLVPGESIGITAEHNERPYSSVHYLVQPSIKPTITIEIQVRTLADEIWGQIDHKNQLPLSPCHVSLSRVDNGPGVNSN